ncbi:HHL228Cp [Eremothecium sinecaudum]|uniref:HHL228Cp n=1 Tax=Eremothecium sinecaudum TaxID=45286 RepID=A0A0X8HW34_9SACH|nr:HHL228Cp [Eremothecium sinecaudum]AMD22542.1 HHL228Cp [Eremothecium sinecaudum]
MDLIDLLGYLYVGCWSVSMYPPLWNNMKLHHTKAVSKDYVILNSVGYCALILSMLIYALLWADPNSEVQEEAVQPTLTVFDFWYGIHSWFLNMMLATQVIWGRHLWGFKPEPTRRMKVVYVRLIYLTFMFAAAITINYLYQNWAYGRNNVNTLLYCNRLYLIKITMSVVKYIAQIKHNFEHKSMKGFPMLSVMLDALGGIFSLVQLVLQLAKAPEFTMAVFIANFGKIGIGMVTLFFNFIYVSQWLLYR